MKKIGGGGRGVKKGGGGGRGRKEEGDGGEGKRKGGRDKGDGGKTAAEDLQKPLKRRQQQ